MTGKLKGRPCPAAPDVQLCLLKPLLLLLLNTCREPSLSQVVLCKLNHPPYHVAADRPTSPGWDISPVIARRLYTQFVGYFVPKGIQRGPGLGYHCDVSALSLTHSADHLLFTSYYVHRKLLYAGMLWRGSLSKPVVLDEIWALPGDIQICHEVT